jgi:hypothetical protein
MTTVLRNVCATLTVLLLVLLSIVVLALGLVGGWFFAHVIVAVIFAGVCTGKAIEARELAPAPRDVHYKDERACARATRWVVVTAWLAFAYVLPRTFALPILLVLTFAALIAALAVTVAMEWLAPSAQNTGSSLTW